MRRNVEHHRTPIIGQMARLAALVTIFGLCFLLVAPLAAAQDDGESAIVPVGSGEVVEPADDAPADVPVDNAMTLNQWAPPTTVYIPETGQTIDGYFLDVWRAWGGVNSWGYPITPEFEENGHIVQYYGYARFEYWPEDPDGVYVHFGAIGAELQPPIVRRSITTFGAPDQSASRAANEAAKAARAWLPIDPEKFGADTASWRFIPETGHSVSWGFKDFWEATGGPDYLGNPLTEEYTIAGTTYQVFERGQLAWRPDTDPWMMPVGELLAERYGLDRSPVGQGDIPTYSEDLFVRPLTTGLQAAPDGERWIEVNLSSQYLIAWQGNTPVLETYVSTGRPGFDTPAGTFSILTKLPSQTMEGVLGGEYYNVPDVPYVMYFTNNGHALHGTYWHANFGAVMSHGCVNLPMDVAAWMYDWAPIGARVEIHY